MQNLGLDALLCIFPDDAIAPALKALRQEGFPILCAGLHKISGVSCLFHDYKKENRKAVKLLASDRKRIMLLLPESFPQEKEAIEGYLEGLSEVGLEFNKTLIVHENAGTPDELATLLATRKPDAIIFNGGIDCYWDLFKNNPELMESCMLYGGALYIYDAMGYKGYVTSNLIENVACQAIDDLCAQMDGKSPSEPLCLPLPTKATLVR